MPRQVPHEKEEKAEGNKADEQKQKESSIDSVMSAAKNFARTLEYPEPFEEVRQDTMELIQLISKNNDPIVRVLLWMLVLPNLSAAGNMRQLQAMQRQTTLQLLKYELERAEERKDSGDRDVIEVKPTTRLIDQRRQYFQDGTLRPESLPQEGIETVGNRYMDNVKERDGLLLQELRKPGADYKTLVQSYLDRLMSVNEQLNDAASKGNYASMDTLEKVRDDLTRNYDALQALPRKQQVRARALNDFLGAAVDFTGSDTYYESATTNDAKQDPQPPFPGKPKDEYLEFQRDPSSLMKSETVPKSSERLKADEALRGILQSRFVVDPNTQQISFPVPAEQLRFLAESDALWYKDYFGFERLAVSASGDRVVFGFAARGSHANCTFELVKDSDGRYCVE